MGSAAQVPTSFGRELRACLRCRLIKTYDQDNFMYGANQKLVSSLAEDKFVPGCYTLSVAEVLSEEMQAVCEDNSVQYVPPKQYN